MGEPARRPLPPDPPVPTDLAVQPARRELNADDHVEGVLAGDRAVLGRTITLLESAAPAHRDRAQEVLQRVLPRAGGAHRVGITGVPGAGKSTLIDALGARLTAAGRRLAVLAVDPSSTVSGGSILGDKTRMPLLSADPRAFVRPSPSVGTLGGVARRTRETILLCEAAGFDVVLVETVGVGQSEVAVAGMVDFFLVLALAGAGDELQGIKRGVIELADLVAVTKADGANRLPAERAAEEYRSALRTLRPASAAWRPPTLTVSSLTGEGLDALWEQVLVHRARLSASGEWEERRRRQLTSWLWSQVEERLLAAVRAAPGVRALVAATQEAVEQGRLTPGRGADRILEAFGLEPSAGARDVKEGGR